MIQEEMEMWDGFVPSPTFGELLLRGRRYESKKG